jgi:hypothetical protein
LVALRTLLRHRARLLEHRAPHILHIQKALLQMNLQLSQVLTDVTGETGLRIVRAIVAGERDPYKLAAMRNYRCKKDEREIARALTGTWRQEHLFVLESVLKFRFRKLTTATCDGCWRYTPLTRWKESDAHNLELNGGSVPTSRKCVPPPNDAAGSEILWRQADDEQLPASNRSVV